MAELSTQPGGRFHVKPTRRQALLAALTGRGFDTDGTRVRALIPIALTAPAGRHHAVTALPGLRLCCGTPPYTGHREDCIATPAMQAEIGLHEEFTGRSELGVAGPDPWKCVCGAVMANAGGHLVHPDPPCAGLTEADLARARAQARPGYLP